MDDGQWLQTWQAVCQKEAEMKISQQQSFEKFRNLEMKMRLMDLRIETAFKIRDDYLNKLLAKYPNWKPSFVSIGLPKTDFTNHVAQNKTELAISQLVDMDMLQNWDEKITLDQLLQSKLQHRTRFVSNVENGTNETIQDLKSGLEQVKKQLHDITAYLKDLKSVPIQEQPKTVSISRRQSFRDRDYSATEHIRVPKPADNAGSRFAEADMEDDFDNEEPKPSVVQPAPPRPAVVPKEIEPKRPAEPQQPQTRPEPPQQQTVVKPPQPEPVAPQGGPRFNFGPPKEPAGVVVEPKVQTPTVVPPSPVSAPAPAKEPAAVIISAEPKAVEQKTAIQQPIVQKPAEVKKHEVEPKAEPKKPESFFTDPIKEDTHSISTPESTPEIRKSSKVVKGYEALLGIVKESSFETRKKQDSDSDSSDEIEKRIKSPPINQSKVSLAVDNALGLRSESQSQLTAGSQAVSPAKQSKPDFLLDAFPKSSERKLSPSSPPKSRQASSSLLSAMAPKEQPKPAAQPKKEEPMSDPDDFLAKLFPDKFGAGPAKKPDEKPKGGPVASLFGERKPKKSAFFVGDDSDSETVDIPKKKTQIDDDFDFFN